MTPSPPPRVADAVPVTDRLLVGGDLDPQNAAEHARDLAEAGVTHVFDARLEWRDDDAWAEVEGVDYRWDGIDDAGQEVPDAWFDQLVDWALAALEQPGTVVLTHCHMGVNRGPSAGYAVLLALGWDPVGALEAIRAVRPQAWVAYAEDALRAHHARHGVAEQEREGDRARLARYREEHDVEVHDALRRTRAQRNPEA